MFRSRTVPEGCVVVRVRNDEPLPSREVLGLTRALAPYLAVRPGEVTAMLHRCGIDPRLPANAR